MSEGLKVPPRGERASFDTTAAGPTAARKSGCEGEGAAIGEGVETSAAPGASRREKEASTGR